MPRKFYLSIPLISGGITLDYNDFAADAMWSWQINPQLAFTLAARVDHLALNRIDPLSLDSRYTVADYRHAGFTAPSYNSGLVWQPTDNDTLRLLTGRAVQAPSLLDLGIDYKIALGPLNVLEGGNPYLKPSISTNYEVDYDHAFRQIFSVLRSAVFFNTTRDMLAFAGDLPFSFSGNAAQSYSENIGSGQALGAEISLQGANDAGFRWNASYSLVGVRNKTSYPPPTSPESFNNTSPTSEVDLGVGYSWQQWEFDAQAQWQSNFQDYRARLSGTGISYIPVTIENFVTLSARISYQLTPALTLSVAGSQLQAPQTVETAGIEPERRILFSVNYGF